MITQEAVVTPASRRGDSECCTRSKKFSGFIILKHFWQSTCHAFWLFQFPSKYVYGRMINFHRPFYLSWHIHQRRIRCPSQLGSIHSIFNQVVTSTFNKNTQLQWATDMSRLWSDLGPIKIHNWHFSIVFFQRVIKMFAVVVVVFTVSWLPYHLFFLISYQFPQARK